MIFFLITSDGKFFLVLRKFNVHLIVSNKILEEVLFIHSRHWIEILATRKRKLVIFYGLANWETGRLIIVAQYLLEVPASKFLIISEIYA